MLLAFLTSSMLRNSSIVNYKAQQIIKISITQLYNLVVQFWLFSDFWFIL